MNHYYIDVGNDESTESVPVDAPTLEAAFRRAIRQVCGRQDWKHWRQQGRRYVKVSGRTCQGVFARLSHGYSTYGERI